MLKRNETIVLNKSELKHHEKYYKESSLNTVLKKHHNVDPISLFLPRDHHSYLKDTHFI